MAAQESSSSSCRRRLLFMMATPGNQARISIAPRRPAKRRSLDTCSPHHLRPHQVATSPGRYEAFYAPMAACPGQLPCTLALHCANGRLPWRLALGRGPVYVLWSLRVATSSGHLLTSLPPAKSSGHCPLDTCKYANGRTPRALALETTPSLRQWPQAFTPPCRCHHCL